MANKKENTSKVAFGVSERAGPKGESVEDFLENITPRSGGGYFLMISESLKTKPVADNLPRWTAICVVVGCCLVAHGFGLIAAASPPPAYIR